MVVLDGRWMLPLDEATQLLNLLCRATPVTRSYESGRGYVYRFAKPGDNQPEYAFSPLSVAQMAAMHLETD